MEDAQQAKAIQPGCKALRMIRPEDIKETDEGPRPSSIAFQDRPESGAMSVFLEDVILANDRSPKELLARFPGYRICYLTVQELTETHGQLVDDDPQEFPGHALVRDRNGKRSKGTRSRMSLAAKWYEPSD